MPITTRGSSLLLLLSRENRKFAKDVEFACISTANEDERKLIVFSHKESEGERASGEMEGERWKNLFAFVFPLLLLLSLLGIERT